jgi:CBS domain-containing protein
MTKTVKDVMTTQPVQMTADTTLADAARVMRDSGIGTVIIAENGRTVGIATDRDIVIRAVADGAQPTTRLGDVCSSDLTTVTPDTALDQAVGLMRSKSLRRLPVMKGDTAVGIVSLGDFAQEMDGHSALAQISAARANR